MTGFFLTLLAALLAGLGARDQITLAELARVQGPRPAALAVGIATCFATSAFAAWASLAVAPMMIGDARLFLAGLALGLAGLESLVLSPGRTPQEPTRSLAALGVVMAAHQLTDAVRFLIFALALAANSVELAAAGGMAAGVLLLTGAVAAPDFFTWERLRLPRRVIGAGMLVIGVVLALRVVDF